MRAVLAGIGAASIVGAVLTAIGAELWFQRVLVFPPGPMRLEPLGLVSYGVGGFVAARLGGWRAVAGIGLFVAVAFGYKLSFSLLRGVEGPDPDFFLAPAWAFSGVLLGTALALLRRGEMRLIAMMHAGGAYAIGRLAWVVIYDIVYTITWTGGERPAWMNWMELSGAVWSAGLGLIVGLFYGARLSRIELATVAVSAALTSAVVVAHQGEMAWAVGPTWFLATASGLIGGIGILVGAASARLRNHASSFSLASPLSSRTDVR